MGNSNDANPQVSPKDVTLELDPSRATAHDILVDELGEETVQNLLNEQLNQYVTQLFDTRDQLRQQQANVRHQALQQAGLESSGDR